MKNVLTYLIVAVLFFTLFYGCEKSNLVSYIVPTPDFIPIAKGNTWYYSGVAYDTLGMVREKFGEIHDVRGDTILFGKKLTFYAGSYVAISDSGLIGYAGYSTNSNTPNDTTVYYHLLYKYPAKTGDKFNYGMRVGTIDTLINVPAGSFHCIQYMGYYQGTLYYNSYVSPGTGLIKIEAYFGDNYPANPSKVSSTIELKTYTLN
ncbi:MAG: hypothetical protein AUJ54_09315 [Ignavibacteria bacterium CG1_02_37_35]|nr:hypothetical protein [Ignavibacteria bacterium]OIO17766.1 MAG: hypothetical protein AUJ54_09315 [Ignavibacteria bacterium CG1_02_37_35]PJC57385.1 MAG: hypothetical protein CO025_13655 [Ignavibacteria bacterium CG_4_9_14_0_2_um_filter_37_13]